MAQNIEIKKFGLRFGYHDALYPPIPYKTPQIAHGGQNGNIPRIRLNFHINVPNDVTRNTILYVVYIYSIPTT